MTAQPFPPEYLDLAFRCAPVPGDRDQARLKARLRSLLRPQVAANLLREVAPGSPGAAEAAAAFVVLEVRSGRAGTVPERARRQVEGACAHLLPGEEVGAWVALGLRARRVSERLADMRGSSEAMNGLRQEVWRALFADDLRVARALRPSRSPGVLVVGPTGTGKELVAQALLEGLVEKAEAPRLAANVGAIPDTLVDAELFGVAKGAATGVRERVGLFQAAEEGALFLDEIGEAPRQTQVRLLRVLQDGEVRRVGSAKTERVAVRCVFATNRELRGDPHFRQDLYYRLAGTVIRTPPLAERGDDVYELSDWYVGERLDRESDVYAARVDLVRRALHERFRGYPWPGNLRELFAVVDACLLGGAPRPPPATAEADPAATPVGRRAPLADVERWYVRLVLEECDGNRSAAARRLGIDRSTLRRKLEEA